MFPFRDDKIIVARLVAVILALAFLVYSLTLVRAGWTAKWPATFDIHCVKIQQVIVWCIWTVFPPLWFLLEFALFKFQDPNFEKLKYGQDLAAKIWIAVAAVLLVLYFGKDIKEAKPPQTAQTVSSSSSQFLPEGSPGSQSGRVEMAVPKHGRKCVYNADAKELTCKRPSETWARSSTG
jgi:hypothetical protein